MECPVGSDPYDDTLGSQAPFQSLLTSQNEPNFTGPAKQLEDRKTSEFPGFKPQGKGKRRKIFKSEATDGLEIPKNWHCKKNSLYYRNHVFNMLCMHFCVYQNIHVICLFSCSLMFDPNQPFWLAYTLAILLAKKNYPATTHPKINKCHLKRDHLIKANYIHLNQPSIFRGHSFVFRGVFTKPPF